MPRLACVTGLSLALGCALLTGCSGSSAPAGYIIEADPAQRIEATLTFPLADSYPQRTEWAIFAAKAPELPGQIKVNTILKVANGPDTGVTEVPEISAEARPLLRARFKGSEANFTASVTYQVTLVARKLVPKTSASKNVAQPVLSPQEEKSFLASSATMDLQSSAFRKWLDDHKLHRSSSENDIDFARRVFQAIRDKYSYTYESKQDRHVSYLACVTNTDCGGMSLLFVSALRASHIPARTLWGRWALTRDKDYLQWHVKAEFFAKDVGWVPVDLASAVLHDKSKERLVYFGSDPGNFLTMHVDPDLEVPTGLPFGTVVQPWMQGVAFWFSGPGGKMARGEDWQVRRLP